MKRRGWRGAQVEKQCESDSSGDKQNCPGREENKKMRVDGLFSHAFSTHQTGFPQSRRMSMNTNKVENSEALQTNAMTVPNGTAMLQKRRLMTQQQARHTGKLGRADLHMHSTYSDGIGTIQQVFDYTQEKTNLDVIALTDHDVIEGALRAREIWSKGAYRFDFIVGEEVSTRSGHLLALFIEKRIPPHLSMEDSIDLIHAQ